jgi:hypothetical protein
LGKLPAATSSTTPRSLVSSRTLSPIAVAKPSLAVASQRSVMTSLLSGLVTTRRARAISG